MYTPNVCVGPFLDIGIPCGGLFSGAEEVKTEEEAAIWGGTAGVAYDVNYHKVRAAGWFMVPH
jgi:carboxypeptidase Q